MTPKDIVKFQDTPIANFNSQRELKLSALWENFANAKFGFKGGYEFKNYINQPHPVLSEIKIPDRVIIPLRQGFGGVTVPLVKKGDKVVAGQIIGRDDKTVSSPVHSSVNGIVEDVKDAVLIRTTDFSSKIQRLEGYSSDWQKLSSRKLEELVYLSGVASLAKEGIPTIFNSSVILPENVKHLIIHHIDSEPYNMSLDLLFGSSGLENFLEGVKILKKIMPKAEVHIAINANKHRLIKRLLELSSGLDWLKVCPLQPKYPQEHEVMLVQSILKQEIPFGFSAAKIGVVVLKIDAVLNVYKAVTQGLPLIEKIAALCGPAVKEAVHIKARVGTIFTEILRDRFNDDKDVRLVLGSLLCGQKVSDFLAPFERSHSELIVIQENKEREFLAFVRPYFKADSYTNAFLAKWLPIKKTNDTNQHGEERPCISCGFCDNACPVGIIPHLLSKYVRREIIEEVLIDLGIFKCIDCGLCNFVCPSKIQNLTYIKEGQKKLESEGFIAKDENIKKHTA